MIYRLPNVTAANGASFALWPWVATKPTWERFGTKEEAIEYHSA